MNSVREKILDSARETFRELGYRGATIRKIMQRAGVQTGSIYHFFRDKEDIFSQLFRDVFTVCDGLVLERCGDGDAVFRLSMMCATLLRAADGGAQVQEFFYECFTAPKILETETASIAQWMPEKLRAELPEADTEDFRLRALAIFGALRAFFASQRFETRTRLDRCEPVLLDMVYAALRLSPERIAANERKLSAARADVDAIAGQMIERYL